MRLPVRLSTQDGPEETFGPSGRAASADALRRGRRVPAARVPRDRQWPQCDERRSGNPTVHPPEIAQLRQSSAGPYPPLST
jgi:hypothetical protein